MRLSTTRPSAIGNRKPIAFNPVKHFGADLLWHFGTPDDWWQAFQRALGPELSTVPSTTSDGSVTQLLQVAGGLNASSTYFATTQLSVVAGNFQFRRQDGTNTGSVTVSGLYRNLVSGATAVYSAWLAGNSGTAGAISVREIDLSKIQLWQDPVGTLPVTGPGQTWGLLLDAKDGLARGVEKIANGDFANGAASWILGAGVSVAGGAAVSDGSIGAGLSLVTQDTFPTAGRWFECSLSLTVTAGGVQIRPGGVSGPTISASGTYMQKILAGAADAFRVIAGPSGFTGTIDNISVREIPGYHASQAGAPSRPLFTCRYNRFLATDDFNNAAWSKTACTAAGDLITADVNSLLSQTVTGPVDADHKMVVEAKRDSHDWMRLTFISGANEVQAWFNLATGTLGTFRGVNTGVVTGASITDVGDGWYRCELSGRIPGATGVAALSTTAGADLSFLRVAGTRYMRKPDLRLAIHANTGKPYQRVTSATDMDTEGFPFYSLTDGIDDWASTPVIPLGTMGVSAITIATGVTKLSDAATAVVMEFGTDSSAIAGTSRIVAPGVSGTQSYQMGSKGAGSLSLTAPGVVNTAPHKATLVGEGDITNDIARLTVNNGTPVLSSADQGAGTYTDQIRYLFRRGGATLPFGGHWHGDTGIKRLCTDSEKRRLSAYYNRNVKAGS